MRLATLVLILAAVCAATQSAAREDRRQELDKAVEEFKTITRELGVRPESRRRRGAGVRSKAAWHGRIFENFRNDILDAVPHEIVQRGGTKSLLRRSQFGFNIGGPVVIPRVYNGAGKTFFSFSYEGVRERISRSFLRTIPTVPERTGDYSTVVDQAGEILPIFDPATTRRNPAFDSSQPVTRDNLEYLRDPFPGNRIPQHRIDPVAEKAVTFYPDPNAAVGPFFRNNYFLVSPETNTANGLIAKIDHSIRDRHRISVGTSFSNGLLGSASLFPNDADPAQPDRDFASQQASAEHVFTLSPQTINTFGVEVNANTYETGSGEQLDYAGQLGLAGSQGLGFPVFNFSPYLPMGRGFPVSKNARATFSVTDGFTTRRGKHNVRLRGGHFRFRVNTFWPQYPAGRFRFGAGLTSLPGIVNTGHAFASFLLGEAEFAESSVVLSPSYFRRHFTFASINDQFEVAKGLQFTFGLEVNYNTPRTEKYDRQSNIDLEAINPANGRSGALVVAGLNGTGRMFQPSLARAEPSAGLSWNPRGNPKTVVRLRFARSYGGYPFPSGHWGTQAFNGTPTYISQNVQLEPAVTLSGGLPPREPPFPDLRAEAANDTVADLMDTSDRLPTHQSASLTVERELPASLVLRIGASYSGGKNQFVSSQTGSPNAIPVEALRFRDQLNDEDFNRSLRPYPQYKDFELNGAYPLGRYQRNEWNVRLEKRASQGLTLNVSYGFSRQLDDYSGPGGRQNVYDREAEWSLTRWGHPHQFSFSYVYELPLGTAKPFLSYSDWRRYVINGWSVSGVTYVSSGEPLALSPSFNNTGGVIQSLRVNVVHGVDPHIGKPGPELWFNPAAFDQPPDFTLGNASRTHPTLRAPLSQNHDLSVNKRFALASDRTVEISAVGLNFLNHANWNDPDTEIGPLSAPNVNAGKIIGSRGGRVIQLGLRLSF